MNIECKGCHAFRFSWRVRVAVEKELLNLIYIGKIRVSSRIAYVVSMSMHAEMINSPNPHFEIPICEVQNQEIFQALKLFLLSTEENSD